MTAVDGAATTPRFRLTDSTLRDGSHAVSHQFTTEQVRTVVAALDAAGVPVIEVTHGDGMGGSSFNYGFSHTPETDLLKVAVDTATYARIAVLFVPGIGVKDDLREAADIGVAMGVLMTQYKITRSQAFDLLRVASQNTNRKLVDILPS